MSENSPVAVAAVDEAAKMTGLAGQVSAMMTRGLVTLERAQLGGTASPPDTAKLTVYVGRQDRADGRPAYRAVCDALHRLGFVGASVFLGVDGTARGTRKRARFFSRNIGVPVMIIAVGTGDQVAAALPELESLLRDPLFTVERAQVCKREGDVLAPPPALPAVDDRGRPLWQKLMVYTSEAALHDGIPVHRAIVARLFESQITSGATALRGIWGFHGDRQPHGDRWIQLARQVPVTTILVDSPDRIAAGFELIDGLTGSHGLITSELVPALLSVDGADRRGGTELARFDY
jgi:PII-like signaling protein